MVPCVPSKVSNNNSNSKNNIRGMYSFVGLYSDESPYQVALSTETLIREEEDSCLIGRSSKQSS